MNPNSITDILFCWSQMTHRNNLNRPTMRKRGVTPVIATIILIAGTLVLALVVGAYTFGLFGSNVKTVTLSSATLYGGFTASGTYCINFKSRLRSQQPRFSDIHHLPDTLGRWYRNNQRMGQHHGSFNRSQPDRIHHVNHRKQRYDRRNRDIIHILPYCCCI